MIYPQTYVSFPQPFSLALRQHYGIGAIPDPVTREFSDFPLVIQIDAQRRMLLAYLPPIPAPLVLYSPLDFAAACADAMAGHAQRVLELCGSDPAAVLQPLIDGDAGDPAQRPAPARSLRLMTISKLKLILALEALGMEDEFFAFIASDVKLQRRFDAAQLLSYSDPLLVAAIPIFAAATGQTQAAISALLQSCAA